MALSKKLSWRYSVSFISQSNLTSCKVAYIPCIVEPVHMRYILYPTLFIRSAYWIFNLEIVIWSGDRIFDLEIELSLFNTFRLILMIKQMFPLCFGKSRSRSVICPLRQITLNAFKIDEMSNPVNARSLLLMQI